MEIKKYITPNLGTLYGFVGLTLAAVLNYSLSTSMLSDYRSIPLIIIILLSLYLSSTILGARMKYTNSIDKKHYYLNQGVIVALLTLVITTSLSCFISTLLAYYHDIQYQIESNIILAQEYNLPIASFSEPSSKLDFEDYFFKPLIAVSLVG